MSSKTNQSEALAERLAEYAGDVLLSLSQLPNTKEGRHVRDQLMRCGTSPGAHYAEARSAQSTSDFIHKVGLAAKEARESVHWILTSLRARYLPAESRVLAREGRELTAILGASLQTARKNRGG